MATIKTENYHAKGTNWSSVIPLDGGLGKDFAFRIYQRNWDDRRIQRLSCAALNPTGSLTNLFFHIDFPVFTGLDADGAVNFETMNDTVNFVVYDNGEWKNKRSFIEFLAAHYGVPDVGLEFAGPKRLDLVFLDGPIHLRELEQRRCLTKATWNDFEFVLGFDLPNLAIEIREIDPRYREPLLRYLSDPSTDVPRERNGSHLTPKAVIEQTLQMLAEQLHACHPTLALSQRTLRIKGQRSEAVLKFQADRNNRAGRYVGVSMMIECRGLAQAPNPAAAQALLRTHNLNGGFQYELSRYQQREIIVRNIARYVADFIVPQLENEP